MKIRSLLFLAGMLASATSSAAMVAFNYTALADGGGLPSRVRSVMKRRHRTVIRIRQWVSTLAPDT